MNNQKYIGALFVMVMLLSHSYIATAEEGSDINSAITTMMEKMRSKQEPNELSEAQLKSTDPNIILSILTPYEKSPFDMVKRTAYRQEFRLAHLQPSLEVRQEVVKRFVKELTDPNSNINPYPYECLLKFKAADFNSSTKALIRLSLDKKGRKGELVRLVGVANIIEEQPRLGKLLIDELAYQAEADKTGERKWYLTLGWSARLALARTGVEENIDRCVSLIEQEIDKAIDESKNFRLFDDLGYIRQPAAIESLRKYLMRDERFRGTNPGMFGEPISNYANDILAASLANYPIKRREDRIYKQEEIELCRKWMSEQKEWKIIR